MSVISEKLLKITFFQNSLFAWFDEYQRIFPWRNQNITNYQIVISEVLLQRTKAETISKFYQKFIDYYPDWESIANDDLSNIEEALKPIGLYKQRAKRLQQLAIEMASRGGILPFDRGELDKIPMIGQYIANAIELQVFKKNMPLLDVNMARVLERFFEPRKMADIRYDPGLQDLAFKIVNIDRSKELNWAILDFAAIICKARIPLCLLCPISSQCLYFLSSKSIDNNQKIVS